MSFRFHLQRIALLCFEACFRLFVLEKFHITSMLVIYTISMSYAFVDCNACFTIFNNQNDSICEKMIYVCVIKVSQTLPCVNLIGVCTN